MMTPSTLLAELRNQGVVPVLRDGRLKLRGPATRITPDLVRRVRQHKAALLGHLVSEEQERATIDEALALLNRLKTFTLPAGRMPAAHMIAERCAARLVHWENGQSVFEVGDPAGILAVLRDIEGELIALGGAPEPLVEAVAMVQRTFPGARLL